MPSKLLSIRIVINKIFLICNQLSPYTAVVSRSDDLARTHSKNSGVGGNGTMLLLIGSHKSALSTPYIV